MSNELGGGRVHSLYPPLTLENFPPPWVTWTIKNQPFASAIFGYRMASPMSRDPKHRHLYSKGMLQANPLCYYTEIGFGDNSAAVTAMAAPESITRSTRPTTSPSRTSDGWNDTLSIPEYERHQQQLHRLRPSAGDGLTRCVMADCPPALCKASPNSSIRRPQQQPHPTVPVQPDRQWLRPPDLRAEPNLR